MKDAGLGNKIICQLFDPVPDDPILLAASSQRSPPKVGDVVPERLECQIVCRQRVIFKEAGYDLSQPFPLTLSSAGISCRHHTWRAAMQLNLFLDPCDLPSSPTSSSPPQGAWDQLDETARIAALELLARICDHARDEARRDPLGRGSYHAIHQVLTNPVYAGAYVYGKTRTEMTLDASGVRRKRIRLLPRDHWQVLIKEHHEGFIGGRRMRLTSNALRVTRDPGRTRWVVL